MALYRAEGVVLRRWKLGEADRIIVFASPEHGQIRAVARGVRKTKAKLAGKLDPPAHVALQLYETRGDLDIVTQVETIERYDGIRDNFNKLVRCMAMLETVEQTMRERENDPELFTLLVRALGTLSDRPEEQSPMVMAGFLVKLLAHEGLEPITEACAECFETTNLVAGMAFSIGDGGVLCTECRRGRGATITPDGLAVLQMMLGGHLGRALALPQSPATNEVDHLAVQMVEYHIERRLKSLVVLGQT